MISRRHWAVWLPALALLGVAVVIAASVRDSIFFTVAPRSVLALGFVAYAVLDSSNHDTDPETRSLTHFVEGIAASGVKG